MSAVLLATAILIFTPSTDSIDSIINKAIWLFETRHINSANINISAGLLENLIKTQPHNLIAHYKLSQIYFMIGDHAKTKSEKIRYFDLGLNYAKRALAIDSNSVWAHFWYFANLGALTQQKGVFSSLVTVNEVKNEIETVLRLDSNNVWALNAQANFYYELPTILGGDADKSIAILNRALAIDSNYSMLYVSIAKAHIKKKNYAMARFYLNKLLALENPWPLADYVIDDRPTAIRLLKEIESK
ncbi:MAG: hypothetical protein N2748_03845 [candidate division WOR-3 bacterium]|nr:hypothetical protein [candidate division WOR-3 bacterium]